jgi:hypothetical protein
LNFIEVDLRSQHAVVIAYEEPAPALARSEKSTLPFTRDGTAENRTSSSGEFYTPAVVYEGRAPFTTGPRGESAGRTKMPWFRFLGRRNGASILHDPLRLNQPPSAPFILGLRTGKGGYRLLRYLPHPGGKVSTTHDSELIQTIGVLCAIAHPLATKFWMKMRFFRARWTG